MTRKTLETKSIVNEKGNNSTIENAVKIVDRVGHGYEQLKNKELGLRLVLLGMTEIQSLRLANLATKLIDLDNEVFSEENLKDVDPKKVLELWEMANSTVESCTNYINKTLSSTDWGAIEVQLLTLASEEEENAVAGDHSSESISKVAGDILSVLGSNSQNFNS